MVEALDAEREVLFPNQPNHQTASLNCYPWRFFKRRMIGVRICWISREFPGVSRMEPSWTNLNDICLVSDTPRRSRKFWMNQREKTRVKHQSSLKTLSRISCHISKSHPSKPPSPRLGARGWSNYMYLLDLCSLENIEQQNYKPSSKKRSHLVGWCQDWFMING